jgi:hypothetical protein
MRTIQYARAGCVVGTLVACALTANTARADVSTERPGSLLIFPKVVQADGRETIIQITNTGNSVDNLHCFYIAGQDGPSGHPLCRVTDFSISLTKQQPTHWDVRTGRPVNPTDQIAGFDPGIIPPVGKGFTGALVCTEVGDDNVPVAMNKIKGEATLVGPNGDVSKYNGVAIQGNATGGVNNGDNILSLNPNGVEYDACKTAAIFNIQHEGLPDPVIEALGNGGTCDGGDRDGLGCSSDDDCPGSDDCVTGQSRVINTITALPCNLDFEHQTATKFKLNYLGIGQDEVALSGSSNELSCWASIDLGDPSQNVPVASLVGPYSTLRITTSEGGPVLLVGESFHVDADGHVAAAAVNLHMTGLCQASGAQAPDIHLTCQANADCPESSICVLSQSSTIRLPAVAP